MGCGCSLYGLLRLRVVYYIDYCVNGLVIIKIVMGMGCLLYRFLCLWVYCLLYRLLCLGVGYYIDCCRYGLFIVRIIVVMVCFLCRLLCL